MISFLPPFVAMTVPSKYIIAINSEHVHCTANITPCSTCHIWNVTYRHNVHLPTSITYNHIDYLPRVHRRCYVEIRFELF